MSGTRLEADVGVDAFAITIAPSTKRLDFPRAEIDGLTGHSDGVGYAAHEVVLDRLHARLDRTHWQAEAGSAGKVTLKADDGSFEVAIARVELSRGVTVTHGADGIEILAPHASLLDVELRMPRFDPIGGTASTALVRAVDAPLRQDRLHVLDSLTGEIAVTVKVVLDLPVLGRRTLDQPLRIPIKDGSLDFRALENSLNWLEGRFVDLAVKKDRLVLSWRVPIFGRSHEIVSFELGADARTLAVFERVPLRALADYRLPTSDAPASAAKGRQVVESLTLSDIALHLSMAAPRSVEIGRGAILFGGDAEPGIVGLDIAGHLFHPPAPGGLTGSIALLDVTTKDLPLGPLALTVDRLHLGAVEDVSLAFDGFTPAGLTARIHRITASNLALHIPDR